MCFEEFFIFLVFFRSKTTHGNINAPQNLQTIRISRLSHFIIIISQFNYGGVSAFFRTIVMGWVVPAPGTREIQKRKYFQSQVTCPVDICVNKHKHFSKTPREKQVYVWVCVLKSFLFFLVFFRSKTTHENINASQNLQKIRQSRLSHFIIKISHFNYGGVSAFFRTTAKVRVSRPS